MSMCARCDYCCKALSVIENNKSPMKGICSSCYVSEGFKAYQDKEDEAVEKFERSLLNERANRRS